MSNGRPPGDGPPEETVPVAFTTTRARPAPPDGPTSGFEALRGHDVEVLASGFVYRGRLEGADERYLYLRAPERWWTVPLDRIGAVRPARPRRLTPQRVPGAPWEEP